MANGNGNLWSAGAMVVIVLALCALSALSLWEHGNRRDEHEAIGRVIQLEMQQLVCTSKLNVFIQMQPKEKHLDLTDIPPEYWLCLPRSLIKEPGGK